MAVLFVDSFDPYAITADMTTSSNAWVVGSSSLQSASSPFGVGQFIQFTGTSPSAVWGSNESTIYGSIRFKVTTSTSANYGSVVLLDGATAQTTIRLNGDGSISLYTGGPAGTLIQTYSAMYTTNTWNSMQFKVVINNTTGSIEIRLNGAGSDTINKTSINTRGGTANNYANAFQLTSSGSTMSADDLLLNNTSGNAPTSWPGDLRALQQVPASAVSSNFSGVCPILVTGGITSTTSQAANACFATRFSPTYSGKINTAMFTLNAGITGHVGVAIYDATGTGGAPGSSMANASITNPVIGSNTVTFSSPPTVVAGTNYYAVVDQDVTTVYKDVSGGTVYTATITYASFPTTATWTASSGQMGWTFTMLPANFAVTNELTQDGDTTYIYASSVVEDQMGMVAIPTTYSVVAAQYYVCWRKSDVGARTVQLSVAANGSADTALITNSSLATNYVYQMKTMEVDPTGATWTPTTVNGAVIGVAVTA